MLRRTNPTPEMIRSGLTVEVTGEMIRAGANVLDQSSDWDGTALVTNRAVEAILTASLKEAEAIPYVEITPEMFEAGLDAYRMARPEEVFDPNEGLVVRSIYRAMFLASGLTECVEERKGL